MADSSEVRAAFDDGRLFLVLDDERIAAHLLPDQWDAKVRLVHVVSRPAGGEVRGYVLRDGVARLRCPARPEEWPELDAEVASRLSCRVEARCRSTEAAR